MNSESRTNDSFQDILEAMRSRQNACVWCLAVGWWIGCGGDSTDEPAASGTIETSTSSIVDTGTSSSVTSGATSDEQTLASTSITVDTQSTTSSSESATDSTVGTTVSSTSSNTSTSSSSTSVSTTDSSDTSHTTSTTSSDIPPESCEQRHWSEPVRIQADVSRTGSTSQPKLVVDRQSNVTVFWQEFNTENPGSRVFFNRYEPLRGGWQVAQSVAKDMPTESLKGAVVDHRDNIWLLTQTSSGHRAYRYDVTKRSFGEPVIVGSGTLSHQIGPLVDKSGNVWVLFVDPSTGDLEAARYDVGDTTWTLYHKLNNPSAAVNTLGGPAELALDERGDAFAVYNATDGFPRTWTVHFDSESRAWSEPYLLGTSTLSPTIAALPGGGAFAAWREIHEEDEYYHYRASRWRVLEKSWTEPFWLETPPDAVSVDATIEPLASGEVLVAIMRRGQWSTLQGPLETGPWTANVHKALSGDVGGAGQLRPNNDQCWAVWAEYDDARGNVGLAAQLYDSALGWSVAQWVDDASPYRAFLKHVAVNPRGTPVVIWLDRRGSQVEDLRAACFDQLTKQWTPSQVLDRTNRLGLGSGAIAAPDGSVTAVWMQLDDDEAWWASRWQ